MKRHALLLFLFMIVACLGVPSLSAQSVNSAPVQGNSESDKPQVTISVAGNKLYVLNAPEKSKIEIRNMLGEKVFEADILSAKEEFYIDLKKGFYIAKIDNTLQRIVVR